MNGVDAALFIGLVTLLILAVGAGGFLAARNPAFWYGLVAAIVKEAAPRILSVITKRNPPEIEKKMQECYRRGGVWDNFNKRCK